jgi:CMP-N-acetylneuraminic acid synthetase
MSVLAIIPARGGSKGIPRKNIYSISGMPLLAYSIKHALEAKTVDRVLVTTDDEEIRQIAIKAGAEAPFLRPAVLAADDSPDQPVFEHALDYLKSSEGYTPDIVVHLRPTSPIRPLGLIDECISMLKASGDELDSVVTVSEVSRHPFRMFRLDDSSEFARALPIDDYVSRFKLSELPHLIDRHEWPQYFYYNCVVDVLWSKNIAKYSNTTGSRIGAIKIPNDIDIDIDTLNDIKAFEFILNRDKK